MQYTHNKHSSSPVTTMRLISAVLSVIFFKWPGYKNIIPVNEVASMQSTSRNGTSIAIIIVLAMFWITDASAEKFKKWECEGVAQGVASYYNTLYDNGMEALTQKVKHDEKRYPEAKKLQQAAMSFAIIINMAMKEENPGVRLNTNDIIEAARTQCYKVEF